MKRRMLLLLVAPLAFGLGAVAPAPTLENRLGWGLADGSASFSLEAQLHPDNDDGLPQPVQAQIDALEISRKSITQIGAEVHDLQQAVRKAKGTPDAQAAQRAYQQKLNDLWRQAQARSLLRDLYSRNQLKEQLTWFWMNHFNVFAPKSEIRAVVGDYEDTIRAHALGHFAELLSATVLHPAMLEYLDNAQNAAGHINENYAREIMELHTLGVGSGYTQQDVQELARILSGLGVNPTGAPPTGRPRHGDHRGQGLTLFNPDRHDFGDKTFLGSPVAGDGLTEIDKAITILVLEPPTARFVSRKLAQYFCCDTPSDALVTAMAATWRQSQGDIAQVLHTLFVSPEFAASLGHKFKDPMRWTLSALRAAYGNQVIVNPLPIINWLNRMGEPLFGHETPDGYPLTEDAWAGPGELETRFEIARQIGAGVPQLFQPAPPDGQPQTPPPHMPPPPLEQSAAFIVMTLQPATRAVIAQGATPADRNMLFLSSPDFMRN